MHPPIIHLVTFASLFEFLVWGVSHVGLWALMLLSAFGAGAIFLRKRHFEALLERLVFTLTLGLGLWALTLFFLGLCGALYRPVIWAMTIVSATGTVFYVALNGRWRLSFELLSSGSLKEDARPRRLLIMGLAAFLVAYAGLLLLAAQYPPLHWDATAGHLVLARQYLIEHRIVALRGGAFPLLPALNHMLFSWAMALKDDILAQMVEYTFLMLTALGLFAWGQRQQLPGLGLAAAALWLSHPLVLWLGESAYVDVGVTCFAFLGVYALRVFWDKREDAWWLLGAALLGMAAGTKMPALFFVVAGAALGIWAWIRSRIAWRELILGYVIVLIVAVPWYGFIAYHTGNPVWPMFPQFTNSEWVLSTRESFDKLTGGGGLQKTFLNYLQLPVYLGLSPKLFFPDNNRDFTPIIALLPLAWIVGIWHRSVRWWSLWILVYTAYWFKFASFMRYWLPVLPIVGLALYECLAWGLGKITKSSLIHKAVWISLTVLAIGYGFISIQKDLRIKGRLPITAEGRRTFLSGLNPGFRGVDYINQRAQSGDTALVFNGYYLAYYLQPSVTGMLATGADRDPAISTWIWPKNTDWLNRLDENKTTWILLQNKGLNLPEQSPFDRPGGPSYELVYSAPDAYVWRRAPLPPALGRDAAALKQRNPCADQVSPDEYASPDYDGYHDTASCGVIEGWAWDANRRDCPVNVNIFDGDTLLATIPADRPRVDLERLGMGDGRHGFKYLIRREVSQRFRDGKPHRIRVTIAGSEFALRATPKTINCPSAP